MNRETRQLMLEKLELSYPNPASELVFENDYELVTAVILSAQCTDRKVNEVTPTLFARYPSFDALAKAKIEDVEKIIRPINYYRTKAKNLINMARVVSEKYEDVLPDQFADLITLPGVGRKTANVVLSERGVSHTIAVDTHVFRVARRLGLSKGTTPLAVEQDLMKRFPEERWRALHHLLILHGRRVCKAQRPLCVECVLCELCPTGRAALRN